MTGSGNSGSGNKEKNHKRKKKKNEKWEEAGGEFYQERYPGGQGQAASTADLTTLVVERPTAAQTRPHFPLPSQTARRNSLAHTGRRGYLTRNARKQQGYGMTTATLNNGTSHNVHCMTYTSTMGRVASDAEIHISLMPDMADETIPDEKSTYDALLKIKALPEDMTSKRARKAKLGNIPQRRLSGWLRVKWASQKKLLHLSQVWRHDLPKFRLFRGDIHKIETHCGTAFANVFLFLRWTLRLNLLISLISLGIVIIPYLITNRDVEGSDLLPSLGDGCPTPEDDLAQVNLNSSWSNEERDECCAKEYYSQMRPSLPDKDPVGWGVLPEVVASLNIFPSNTTTLPTSIQDTPSFYGYYASFAKNQNYFAFGYVLVVILSLAVSLAAMIKSVGQGIKEMIMASEGEYNPYTTLVFAGWDHYTKDAKNALFKRKVICHEMKVSLKNEKQTLEKVLRSRGQQWKLWVVRVLVNLTIFGLVGGAGFAIYTTTKESLNWELRPQTENDTNFNNETQSRETLLQNFGVSFAPALLISVLHIIFPPILAKIGILEKYSLQTSTTLVLIRSLIIRLICIGSGAAGVFQLKYCALKDGHTCTACDPSPHDPDGPLTRDPCWENIIAEQLYKLLLADFLLKLFLTLIIQPLRLQLKKCCKNGLLQGIGTMKFSIVRHILDIIYLQLICWIGLYFAPFIPILAVIYAFLIFYVKKFSLLHNCNEIPNALKTMKTTTTFVAAQLIALCAATLTNIYVIGYMTPSRGCGPFRKYNNPWEAVAQVVSTCPEGVKLYETLASPTITVPITLILLLLGYYYYSVAQTNRGMVDTLRHLLILEGHDKQYLFARLNSLRRGGSGGGTGLRSGSRGTTLISGNHSALPTPPPDPPKNT